MNKKTIINKKKQNKSLKQKRTITISSRSSVSELNWQGVLRITIKLDP
jgi:hypothetical protein